MSYRMQNMLLISSLCIGAGASYSHEGADYFTNSWVVEIPNGQQTASSIAKQLGFTNVSPVWLFDNHYFFIRRDHPPRQRRGSPYLTALLMSNEKVTWAEQQYIRLRIKKAFDDNSLASPNLPDSDANPVVDSGKINHHKETKVESVLETIWKFLGFASNQEFNVNKSKYADYFNDPLWEKQWYAHHSSENKESFAAGMNLMDVYKMNITGHGVRVAIVDDGVDIRHPDLQQNYDPDYSFDLNNKKVDPQPPYRPDGTTLFRHGTRCAGVVAMAANNSECGVGLAYNARLAVIKMLEQPGVDVVEGQALQYKCEGIDLFSNSWGPGDNGRIMEGMGTLSGRAMDKCLRTGRNGKGSIYVFPAGNGKAHGDNCGADAYTNSIYSVTIASADRSGRVTYYSERCSAIFATTYSSGYPDGEKVVTTDQENSCHNHFSGTSASVPIASGIIALTLEANGNLTYRDVKHIIVMSTEVAPLADNPGTWQRNGAGFWISMDFGFGLMNALKMVKLAQSWITVPQRRTCSVAVYFRKGHVVRPRQLVETVLETSACLGTSREVRYLEQLQLVPFMSYGCRGAISVHITSPTGTTTTLLETRHLDVSPRGLVGWPLKSVHFWGEKPTGIWTIQTKIHALHSFQVARGSVRGFLLVFYGTFEKPQHYESLPKKYSPFILATP